MLRNISFVKKKKKGNIVRGVREHYLRDDIGCGSDVCKRCQKVEGRASLGEGEEYAIMDLNVFLHQMDLLEHPAIQNVIIAQTVSEELKSHALVWNRVRVLQEATSKHFYGFSNEHFRPTFVERSPTENPLERNDRAMISLTRWYASHLKDAGVRVLFVTNDSASAAAARALGVDSESIEEFVHRTLSLSFPETLDLLVIPPP